MKCSALLPLVGLLASLVPPLSASETILVPELEGDWWLIAEREPDVGEYSNPGVHNSCDFTIWKDADGMWQMDACIRGVKWPIVGERIFHRWEAKELTESPWKAKGVSLLPREELNQYAAIQAPHCFQADGKYFYIYNAGTAPGAHIPFDPENPKRPRSQGSSAFLRVSTDGKTFTDVPNEDGGFAHFKLGRDIMVFHDKDRNRFLAYFQDNLLPGETGGKNGAMYYRSAEKPEGPWSVDRTNIQNHGNPESPFVLKHEGKYYLWEQMKVCVSDTPEKFPEDPVTMMSPHKTFDGKYAPEIIEHEGQFYIAGYNREGIWLSKFRWVPKTQEEIAAWRADTFEIYKAHQQRVEEEAAAKRANP